MQKKTEKRKKKKEYGTNKFRQSLIFELNSNTTVKRLILDIVKSEQKNSNVDLSQYVSADQYKKLRDNAKALTDSNTALTKELKRANELIEDLNDKLKKAEESINEKENELEKARELIKEMESEISRKNEKNTKLTRERNKYKETIDELNQRIDNSKEFIDNYKIMDECFENYLNISETKRHELEGIIYAPTVGSLYACAGRKDFVRRFAEYIVKCIMKEKTVSDDIMYLNKVFDTLFDVANECEGAERYVRDEVNIGDKYSTSRLSTITLQQGTVSDVLFLGYHSIKSSKNEFCKSVVEVSE